MRDAGEQPTARVGTRSCKLFHPIHQPSILCPRNDKRASAHSKSTHGPITFLQPRFSRVLASGSGRAEALTSLAFGLLCKKRCPLNARQSVSSLWPEENKPGQPAHTSQSREQFQNADISGNSFCSHQIEDTHFKTGSGHIETKANPCR